MDLNTLAAKNTSALSLKSRQSSVDSGSSSKKSRGRRLSKLLPKRGRPSTADDNDGLRRLTSHPSVPDVQLNLVDSDTDDLLLTVEDSDSPVNARPTLSPHQSHAGFYTLSSPLIPAETLPNSQSNRPTSSGSLSFANQSNTLTTPSAIHRRSASPSGRLREAFSPKSKPSPISTTTSGFGEGYTIKEGSKSGISRVFSRNRRASLSSKLDTQTPPRVFEDHPLVQEPAESTPSPKKPFTKSILTNIPNTPPGADGPKTFVTPPTPVEPDTEAGASQFSNHRRGSSASEVDIPTGESSAHRRTKSALAPSKLSQLISRPLTPAPEEVKTPGGTLTDPPSNTGFFSSVFSAAQNAATSLSNSISLPGPKAKAGNSGSNDNLNAVEEVVVLNTHNSSSDITEKGRKPAIETLGSGNLSLSHLGIKDREEISPFSSRLSLMETANPSNAVADEVSAKNEDNAAAQAVSKAYTNDKINGEKFPSPDMSKSSTVLESKGSNIHDDSTPIRQSIEPDSSSIKRAGSVRSRLSERRRRTRGSSATASLAPTSYITPSARFTTAPTRRNKDFHNLFKSVPEDDLLIEDYSAAYQREILLQGRLYISEGHICFWSNIFGYVTNLVISFDEVISVEKKSTAMIFQNGLAIQTMHARHAFASLISRDTTYDLIVSMWRSNNPNIKSSLNGAPVDGIQTGDKTEKTGSIIDEDSASEEIYDEDLEDDDDDDTNSFMEARDSKTASEAGDNKIQNRKISSQVAAATGAFTSSKTLEVNGTLAGNATTSVDFPGPIAHEPTDCNDADRHCEKPLIEAIIPVPLGKIYSLVFGPGSTTFMRRFLTEDEKCTELQMANDAGLSGDVTSRTFNYIKPLGGAIGPKQTKCIITETVEQFDLQRAVSILCSTQTPDVPSGSSFVTKTRYCMMWAPGNGTKLVLTYAVEWSGKSWLKGPIEKGAADGQLTYAQSLVAALKASVLKPANSKSRTGKGKNGRRRRDEATISPEPRTIITTPSPSPSSWSFERLTSEPLQMVAIVLLVLTILVVVYRNTGSKSEKGHRLHFGRQRNYDEMWQQQENELWNWIEDRVELQDIREPGNLMDNQIKEKKESILPIIEGMADRELREAIRVTKERLRRLEDAIDDSSNVVSKRIKDEV